MIATLVLMILAFLVGFMFAAIIATGTTEAELDTAYSDGFMDGLKHREEQQ